MIRSRNFLQTEFADGERPSGQDFSDTFDSFIHKDEDGITIDIEDNLIVGSGVTVGPSTNEVGGTIRFQAGVFQFFDGTQWLDLGTGSGGAFQPAGTEGEVAYEGGNVGINVDAPRYKLEVEVAATNDLTDTSERIKLGLGVMTRGTPSTGTQNHAFFMHQGIFEAGDPNTGYALRTDALGNLVLNAPTGRTVTIANNNNSSGNGIVVTGDGLAIGHDEVPQFNEEGLTDPGGVATNTGIAVRLYVAGNAAKGSPGNGFINTSDERTKEEVSAFEAGLKELEQIDPVCFSYNGKAHTVKGSRGVGVIAQALQKVFPEMIHTCSGHLEEGDDETEILLTDTSSLIYVAINAIKELSARVEQLEGRLKKAKLAAG